MNDFGASAAVAPAGLAAAEVDGGRFVGKRRTYWRLMSRGTALMVVTLGIYRFWLTTDMRRFLWANTEVAGETLEYTGTPRELLIGFLVAVAILLPVYAAGFAVVLMLGPIGQVLGPVIGVVGISLFGPYALYRARRFRLTRTIFRGVRFHQTGSAVLFAIYSTLWWAVIVVTLGLAYPLALSSLERFKLRNTFLGDLRGRFEGSAFGLLLRGFFMWLVVIGPLILATVVVAGADFDAEAIVRASTSSDEATELLTPEQYIALGAAAAALMWGLLAAILLFPVFQAMVWRWWAAGLRFGNISVVSNLRVGQVYGIYLRFLGYLLLASLVITVAVSLAGAVAALLVYTVVAMSGGNSADIFGGTIGAALGAVILFVTYIAIAVGFSAVYQVIVKLGLWRCIVDSLRISNAVTLASITAVGGASSPLGEGLADALNVGGI